MAFKKIPYGRTAKIHLKLCYQSITLNSLRLMRLLAQFVDFAHRSFYKMPKIKVEIAILMQ
jgi:hypothetical protein